MLEGLRGNAGNFDQRVTWDSLVDYVKSRVESKSKELNAENTIAGIQRPNSVGNLTGSSPILVREKLPGIQLTEAEKSERRKLAAKILQEIEPDFAKLFTLSLIHI